MRPGDVRIVPLEARHIEEIELQQSQRYIAQAFRDPPSFVAAILQTGPAYAALDRQGRAIAAGGIMEQWPGRKIAWAVFAHNAGPCMTGITRACRLFLAGETGRVEAWTSTLFPRAHKFARQLGFKLEHPCLRGAFPGGGDAALWSRLRRAPPGMA